MTMAATNINKTTPTKPLAFIATRKQFILTRAVLDYRMLCRMPMHEAVEVCVALLDLAKRFNVPPSPEWELMIVNPRVYYSIVDTPITDFQNVVSVALNKEVSANG